MRVEVIWTNSKSLLLAVGAFFPFLLHLPFWHLDVVLKYLQPGGGHKKMRSKKWCIGKWEGRREVVQKQSRKLAIETEGRSRWGEKEMPLF